jgi:ribose transport system permease protein
VSRAGTRFLRERGLLIVAWLALVATFGLCSRTFLSTGTLVTVAGRLPALAVVSAGMTLVIVAGGIDLSVGSVAALAAIPTFLATLGLLEICRGAAYLVTGSRTKYIGVAIEPLARPLPVIGVPATVVISLVTVLVMQMMLARTVFGRHLQAVGGNPSAARYAGIATGRVRVAVHGLSGGLAGLAAVLATARLGSADPNAGMGLELAAIAAVVIGGTSLAGGAGSAIGSLLGVLVIATLEAGLAQLGASDPIKRLVTGAAIIAAVAVDDMRRRIRGRVLPP